jgi:hypothetical protein
VLGIESKTARLKEKNKHLSFFLELSLKLYGRENLPSIFLGNSISSRIKVYELG